MTSKNEQYKTCDIKLTTLCNRENILLQKDKKTNTFYIAFECENSKINLKKLINLKIYNILFQLNKDIFDNIHINKINKNEANVMFLFKSIGKEVGIKKKFLYTKTKIIKNKENKSISFITNDEEYNLDKNISSKYDKIETKYENLFIKKINKHKIQLQYMFNYDIKEELPIYMENVMGFMMKKIFFRLKNFIENLTSLN
jgi:hypothetical protein